MNSNLQIISTIHGFLEEEATDFLNRYLDALETTDFSSAERRRLLYLATDYHGTDSQAGLRLCRLALEGGRVDLIEDVTMSFEYWESDMRILGLTYLAELATSETAVRFAELTDRYYDGLDSVPFSAFGSNEELLYTVLEKTLKCFNSERLKNDYYLAALRTVNLATPEYLAVLKDNLIADMIMTSAEINNFRSFSETDWIWEQEGYLRIRRFASLLLDLAGAVGEERFVRPMRAFMRIRDMKIRFHSAAAVLRLGGRIRKTDYIALAGNAEMRNRFYRTLIELEREEAYPMQFKSNRYFAEGKLVPHLQALREDGRMPSDVIFVHEHRRDDGGLWYVFKYVTERQAGYLPAVVGPFAEADWLNDSALCHIEDVPWDSRDLAAHLESLIPQ